MKIIKIFGEHLKIAFNMAVQLRFEQDAEKPFSLDALTGATDRVTFYMAVISICNPEAKVKKEDILYAPIEEIEKLDKAIYNEMAHWYHIPAMAEVNVPTNENTEEEGAKKA